MNIARLLSTFAVSCFASALATLPRAEAGDYLFHRIAASPGDLAIPNAAPALNNSGQVAFDGMAGAGGPPDARIVRGNGGALTTIASQAGTAVTPALAGFTGGAYAMNAAGQVAFSAYNDGPGSGVYRSDGTTLVVLDDTTDPNVYPAINSAGTVAFRTSTLTGAAIFFGSSGSLTLLATAQAGSGHPFGGIGNPAINDAGTLAFFAQDPPPMPGPGIGQERIFTATPAGVLTEVTNTTSGGWLAMGGGLAGNLVISNSGAVVFEGMKQADGRQGVYLATPDGAGGYTITTVADTTGAYAGFAFDALSGLSVNATNQVAFRAMLDGTGTSGIFTGPDPVAHKVVATGDRIDGKTVQSVSLGRFALNDAGEVAFFVTFNEGGGGVYRATPLATPVHWTDWTASSPGPSGTAAGTLATSEGTIAVNYDGEFYYAVTDESSAQFSYTPIYTPAITTGGDEVLTYGGAGAHHRVAFSAPVATVVMHWYSVGNPATPVNLTFTKNGTATPAAFTLVSFGSEFEPNPVLERQGAANNVLHGQEGSGTLVFTGPISTLEWDTDQFELYFSFQVGTSDTLGANTTTLAPTLTAPAPAAFVGNPITVTYTLPESALPGSVELLFDDASTPRLLHLTAETPGPHTFLFDPAHPTMSGGIASGPAIPDGTYTVVLSYQDSAGNPRASATATGVRVDTTAPAGGTFTATPSTVREGTGVTLSAPGWSDPSGPLSYHFRDDFFLLVPPQPDSTASDVLLPLGTHHLYAEIMDAAGNETTVGPVLVTVTPGPPPDYGPVTQHPYLLRSDAAPTDPDHALFSLLRPPMLNAAGRLAFKGMVFPRDPTDLDPDAITGANDLAIWADKGSTPLAMIARESGAAPGIPGGLFATFSDPLLSDAGEVAFKAFLRTGKTAPGFTSANNEVIYSDAPGSLTIVARKGDLVPAVAPGAAWKTFNALAVVDGGCFGTAMLSGLSTANDFAFWAWQAGDPAPHFPLREGAVLDFGTAGTRTVGTIDLLTPKATVTGQGRSYSGAGPVAWVRASFVGGGAILLKFTSGAALFDTMTFGPKILPASGAAPLVLDPAPGVPGGQFASISSAATNAQGHIAFIGKFKTRSAVTLPAPLPAITTANDSAIWTGSETSLSLLAREGDAAPGVAGGVFAGFLDPVMDDNDRVAFLGTLRTGAAFPGVTTSDNQGIWAHTGEGLKLIARRGVPQSFLPPGAVINSFTSLAVNQRGGLFKAKLKAGAGGITSGRDDILVVWRGADGTATLVFQERQYFQVFPGHLRRLLTFDVITAAPAPVSGVGRSFNTSGQVMAYCTFLDGTTGFIGIDL